MQMKKKTTIRARCQSDEIAGELLGPIIRELKNVKRNICCLLVEIAAAGLGDNLPHQVFTQPRCKDGSQEADLHGL